jgi:hypothetical protein
MLSKDEDRMMTVWQNTTCRHRQAIDIRHACPPGMPSSYCKGSEDNRHTLDISRSYFLKHWLQTMTLKALYQSIATSGAPQW